MTSKPILRWLVPAFLLVLVLAGAAWRAFPGAGAGEILVLPDRAVAGPLRVLVAPWSARRVIEATREVTLAAPIDLGQGASWPVKATATLRVEADRLGDAARRQLLEGADPAQALETAIPGALAAAARELGPREILARPARLAGPLRAPLAAALPSGIALAALDVRVTAPPEQARAAALSAARSGMRPPLARVLYVGLDGADWEIADRLIARGELPNLARFAREGVRGQIVPFSPIISPMLWTSALTGRTPDEHGINDFVLYGDPKNEKEVTPMTSTFRKTPALWEILAAAGQTSGFVNFWATQPAEQVEGVLVSDLAAKALLRTPAPVSARLAWPVETLTERPDEFWTTRNVPPSAVRVYAPRLDDRSIDEARHFLEDKAARDRWKEQNKRGRKMPPAAFLVDLAATSHNVETLALRLLRRADLGLVGVYFEDIDICGHNFIHLAPPKLPIAPADEVALYGDAVDNCYRQQDAMLGRLMAAAGPDTVVVVHSDHGFQSGPRRPTDVLPFEQDQPVEWHRTRGLFGAIGGPVRRGAVVGDIPIMDIAPTLLALRGVPPGENMPGRVRGEILAEQAAARLPVERVPLWDALVPPRQYGDASAEELAEAQAQAIEQLQGLGYVDADATPRAARSAGGAGEKEAPAQPGTVYYRNLGNYLLSEGRFDDAESVVAKAWELKPLPKTAAMLSEARAGRGDIPGAIAALEDGLEVRDDMPPDTIRWLVELHIRAGQVPRAREAFERHRAIAAREKGTPEEIEGLLAQAEGNNEGAKAAYLRALEANPRAARAAENYAALAASPDDRARLAPYLQRGLQQDDRIELYWKMLGLLAAERGDHLASAQAFRRAVELAPGDEALRLAEAAAWRRAGHLDVTRQILEHLARSGTRTPAVWVNVGTLRAEAQDWRGALVAWERARALGESGPELGAAIEDARRRVR